MRIISHRGNLNGINPELENNPEHILRICEEHEVEVDAWYIDEEWFLGHDEPLYSIDETFFNDQMWIHCKNLAACSKLQQSHLNWFWHESDKITITSKGFIWCYPQIYIANGITVEYNYNDSLPSCILGVCTDYVDKYKNK
jgi:hypothetical protein